MTICFVLSLYYRHHLAAHSAAVVTADATTILNAAATLSFFLGMRAA